MTASRSGDGELIVTFTAFVRNVAVAAPPGVYPLGLVRLTGDDRFRWRERVACALEEMAQEFRRADPANADDPDDVNADASDDAAIASGGDVATDRPTP